MYINKHEIIVMDILKIMERHIHNLIYKHVLQVLNMAINNQSKIYIFSQIYY